MTLERNDAAQDLRRRDCSDPCPASDAGHFLLGRHIAIFYVVELLRDFSSYLATLAEVLVEIEQRERSEGTTMSGHLFLLISFHVP